MIGRDANALASSIILVCRKRPADAPVATRRDFLTALKRELKPALVNLQESNIAPVDMAQSAIGPGMAVYSRYREVLEADGTPMTVRTALQIINQELDQYFSEQDGALDRDTIFCVALYTQYAFREVKFGDVDVLARAKNTSTDRLREKGILYAERGTVRLLLRDEMAAQRTFDVSVTWQVVQRLAHALDMALALLLFDLHWSDIFSRKLPVSNRTWVKELKGVRNDLAHLGGKDFTDDDTWRALDTMARLCASIDADSAEEIREILRELRYGSAAGSMDGTAAVSAPKAAAPNTSGILQSVPLSSLPSWRDVMRPHPDVAARRYKNAEFAADLAQVARGEGSFEYCDPVEFFARTYVTEGMAGLLVQALRRISGEDGEPVIQLKTAFGGGKTHSMLALYHMLRGTVPLDKIPAVRPVLERAGLSSLPTANVAVIVGTAIDPTRVQRPPHMPGIMIHTLCVCGGGDGGTARCIGGRSEAL